MAGPSSLPAGGGHPHVALLGMLRATLLLMAGTPVAIGMAIALILPLACGEDPGFRHACAYLEQVRAGDEAEAASWSLPPPWRSQDESAAPWTLRLAAALAPGTPPPGSQALQLAQPAELSPPAHVAAHTLTGPLTELLRRSRAYTLERVWPLLRPWCACTLLRAHIAMQLLLLALPGAAVAYWCGEAAARSRLGQGAVPMAHRSRWWVQLLRLVLASMPATCALPLALPASPLLAILALLGLIAVRQARCHFVEL
jgi:hypothetical protein